MAGILCYCHPPKNILSNFDTEMQYFFKKLLNEDERNVQENPEKFTEVLRIVADENPNEYLITDEPFYETSYLFRFSPCYTSAVADHFLRLMKENHMNLSCAMWNRQVNICCLGGGPGTEVVAITKILSSAQKCLWQATKKPLHLQVTVVDKNSHWKKTVTRVLQTLRSSSKIFDEGKMEISFRFLVADLTKPLEEDVLETLEEADVVTMVNFLSELSMGGFRRISLLVKDIADSMKTDSILFYLETGVTKTCHKLYECFRHFPAFQCVYGPIELEVFTLALPSIRKNVELFWKTFHGNNCETSAIVNSCAWIKLDDRKNKQILSNCSGTPGRLPQKKKQWCLRWENEALRSEEKLLTFRENVARIFPQKKEKN